jgi:hypothetical protein
VFPLPATKLLPLLAGSLDILMTMPSVIGSIDSVEWINRYKRFPAGHQLIISECPESSRPSQESLAPGKKSRP